MKAVPQFEYELISIRDMNRFDPSLGYWQFVAYLRNLVSRSSVPGSLNGLKTIYLNVHKKWKEFRLGP